MNEKNMIPNWKTLTKAEKIGFVISCVAAALWVVSSVKPDLFPINLTYPAIAVFTVGEAVVYWNQKRKWAYLLIAGAVISMAFFLLELWLLS